MKLTKMDWDIILASLLLIKSQVPEFGETKRFNKTYEKVKKLLGEDTKPKTDPEVDARRSNPARW